MKHHTLFLLTLIQCQLLLAYNERVSQEYVVPNPNIEIFSPRGFKVSIPHEDGINLFSFHGSINRPMNGLEAGDFSYDIRKRKNNTWSYENKRTRLEKGDVIYFWLIVIKDNLGYRYDDGRFVVQDILEKNPHNHPETPSTQPTTQSNSDDNARTPMYSPMCEVALNLSNTVDQLTGDIKMYKEINDILKDIVAKDEKFSRTLKFEGVLPPFNDAHYTAQFILKEKLGLNIRISNVAWENGTITFQVASLDDKLYIIKLAKEKLEKIHSKIILKY